MTKLNKSETATWLAAARARGVLANIEQFKADGAGDGVEALFEPAADLIFPSSVQTAGSEVLALIRLESGPALAVFGSRNNGFSGNKLSRNGATVFFCPLNHRNAERLRQVLPYTAPSPLGDKEATFGVGDRLGFASAGHLRLFKTLNAKTLKNREITWAPVLAQQSVREVSLTDRTYEHVLDSASWAVFQEAFRLPWGADGDHLKTAAWVKKCLTIGFTMITADVSDYIRGEYDAMAEAEVLSAYEAALTTQQREALESEYLSLQLELDTGTQVKMSQAELARIVLIYQDAIDYAHQLYLTGQKTGRPFDFELSIDETATPTLPQAHVFIASEAIRKGIKIYSVAPRFVGEFQKGIDYIGDKKEFDTTFRTHAAIARHFGYKISVHSGSDKFAVFPAIGKHTKLKFHVKTAGTNWLQALLVVAETEPAFFRDLYAKALEVFPKARQYYHITPDLTKLPVLGELNDDQLGGVFANTDARQVLHVTYGELLQDKDFKRDFYRIMHDHMLEYWDSLIDHIGRHLKTLGVVK